MSDRSKVLSGAVLFVGALLIAACFGLYGIGALDGVTVVALALVTLAMVLLWFSWQRRGLIDQLQATLARTQAELQRERAATRAAQAVREPPPDPQVPATPPARPLAEPEAPAAAVAHAQTFTSGPKEVAAPRGRVLVVDDDPVMRRLLTLILERSGYAVDSSADGDEAVQQATRRPYVAVLLDVQMPGIDGPTAARSIRERGGEMALIALTGHTSASMALRCRTAGIDEILVKPVTLETLQAALEREIDARTSGVDLSVLRSIVDGEGASTGVELIDGFLAEMEADLAGISRAAELGDLTAVKRSAHRLRGSSAAFGAGRLAEACQRLDEAAQGSKDITTARADVTDVSTSTRRAFEREREGLRSPGRAPPPSAGRRPEPAETTVPEPGLGVSRP